MEIATPVALTLHQSDDNLRDYNARGQMSETSNTCPGTRIAACGPDWEVQQSTTGYFHILPLRPAVLMDGALLQCPSASGTWSSEHVLRACGGEVRAWGLSWRCKAGRALDCAGVGVGAPSSSLPPQPRKKPSARLGVRRERQFHVRRGVVHPADARPRRAYRLPGAAAWRVLLPDQGRHLQRRRGGGRALHARVLQRQRHLHRAVSGPCVGGRASSGRHALAPAVVPPGLLNPQSLCPALSWGASLPWTSWPARPWMCWTCSPNPTPPFGRGAPALEARPPPRACLRCSPRWRSRCLGCTPDAPAMPAAGLLAHCPAPSVLFIPCHPLPAGFPAARPLSRLACAPRLQRFPHDPLPSPRQTPVDWSQSSAAARCPRYSCLHTARKDAWEQRAILRDENAKKAPGGRQFIGGRAGCPNNITPRQYQNSPRHGCAGGFARRGKDLPRPPPSPPTQSADLADRAWAMRRPRSASAWVMYPTQTRRISGVHFSCRSMPAMRATKRAWRAGSNER